MAAAGDILETDIRFEGDGATLRGITFVPAGRQKPLPAVIVIHEADGLNESMKEIARKFARRGYFALAVDLFTGRSKPVCMLRILGSTIMGKIDGFGAMDIRSAIDVLCARPEVDPGRVGIIGFCLGGGLSISVAVSDKRIKVIAPFYGANPSPLSLVERSCPVVGSYPARDFTARSGRKLKAELDKYRVPNDIKIYPGQRHSFANPASRAHDPGAAEDALERTFGFFQRYLGA